MLVAAWLTAALLFALLFRLPDSIVLGESSALFEATTRLAWASTDPEARQPLPQARADLQRRLVRLQSQVLRADLEAPSLATYAQTLNSLPPTPTREQADQLMALAENLQGGLHQQFDARLARQEMWLKALAVLLALSLVLPILGLWRQRQRMRSALRQFGSDLGQGNWHDAVQVLREDARGAPSAFETLASGVEGVMGESDRRWQALADLSADWYWETDEAHRFSRVSGAAPEITALGWAMADLLGKRRDELSFAEAPALGWAALQQRCERHEAFRDIEFRMRARRGAGFVWVSISGRARIDARGDFLGYEGVGRDITERKIAHERLATSEQRWSLMAGLASDWYWETDAEHRLRPLRPEMLRRFPNLTERFEGKTRWEAHARALSPEKWAEHRADLDARRPFRSLRFQMEGPEGRLLWLSISGIPRFDAQGRFLGYHGVGSDITLRKEAERMLLRHNEQLKLAVAERTRELEQLNIDQQAFARELAHELRTPIGHIEGLAGLLDMRTGDRLQDDERQLLQMQVQAAQSMRRTVDALMQLARSTVQAMPMDTLDLSALASATVALLPPLERRAAIEWRIEPGLKAVASAAALEIVLQNLLGNAAKFTRHVDQPVVSVSGRPDADGRLRVVVQDNGAGFEPSEAGRLFTPFSRLHSGEDFQGTGIGLTIVQRIIERHGGTVMADGERGRGARFEFTLQAAPP